MYDGVHKMWLTMIFDASKYSLILEGTNRSSQMRFSIQPEPRPEQHMRTVSIDEIMLVHVKMIRGAKPPLEHYFSPTKKEPNS